MSTTTSDRSRWRAPALGDARVLDLPGGRLAYHDVGSGPPIVFVHGLLVNANLWRKLVERLSSDALRAQPAEPAASGVRCVTLDLPLGSHNLPLPAGSETGPPAVVEMVADAIEALDLDDVTLVGSDTGGALCQMLVTSRPQRIGRLVLASCDYRDNFPPRLFSYFKPAAAVPGLMWALLQPMRLRLPRRSPIAFGWLTKRPIDRDAEDSYVLPSIRDAAARRDARAFIRAADIAQTNAAADRLGEFDRPALIAWSADDRVFPLDDARSLAAALPNSRLELIDDAYTFSMEDNPDRLADLIADFVRESQGRA